MCAVMCTLHGYSYVNKKVGLINVDRCTVMFTCNVGRSDDSYALPTWKGVFIGNVINMVHMCTLREDNHNTCVGGFHVCATTRNDLIIYRVEHTFPDMHYGLLLHQTSITKTEAYDNI